MKLGILDDFWRILMADNTASNQAIVSGAAYEPYSFSWDFFRSINLEAEIVSRFPNKIHKSGNLDESNFIPSTIFLRFWPIDRISFLSVPIEHKNTTVPTFWTEFSFLSEIWRKNSWKNESYFSTYRFSLEWLPLRLFKMCLAFLMIEYS